MEKPRGLDHPLIDNNVIFKVTDTILSLARFKNGGIGLVLVNVDRLLLDKRYQWSINEIRL